MSSVKQICPECRFEFFPDEAEFIPDGRGCPRCRTQVTVAELPEANVPSPPPPLLSSGTIFDKYRILNFVGAGGMGEVYKAEHLLLKQIFALKVMKQQGVCKESISSKRFLREAKCFHLLDHPNIVRVFEIGCDKNSGLLYISMEYLEGGSLAAECGRKLSETEVLKIASDIAKALEALEKNSMVHRDIKPSNIMRDGSGNCKLMDLGIAKNRWENGDAQTLTLDNCVIGTPAYASPEQCCSPHNVDIRSDIYSLGITLYELASGTLPNVGSTPLETILNVIHKEPPPLGKLPTELSARTVRLIECMIEKSPENRPADAASLSRMVDMVRQGGNPVLSRRGLHWKKIISAAGVVLLLGGVSAAGSFLFAEKKSKVVSPAERANVAPKPPEEKSAPPSFLRQQFVVPGKTRTLPARIEEYNRVLDFLNSDAAISLPFRKERQQLFIQWKQNLETLLKRKKERRSRRICISLSSVFRSEIESYLKTNKFHPFFHDPKGIALVRKIITALQAGEIDPDTVFEEKKKIKRSLTGLVLNGRLPMSEHLLKRLIFSGADIDAGHGPESKFPASPYIENTRARLTGIMAFNGADNVDLKDGSSMLLSVLDPSYPFLVCRPKKDNVDWPLANLLVASGALLDVENKQGRAPVHFAALHNKGELLTKMLLAGTTRGDLRDQDGCTPFQLAVRNHASETINVLTRFALTSPVSRADRAQGSLIFAIKNNEPLLAEQALDAGASLDFIYANRLNAMQNAVLYRRTALVKFLLERGVLPESKGTTLSLEGISICTGSPEIFKLLLEKNLPENMTLLQKSTQVWLPETVLTHYRKSADIASKYFDIMLKFKWDINQPGPRGINALERALLLPDVQINVIRYLLEKGADPVKLFERKKVDLRKIDPRIMQLLKSAAAGKH